MKYLYVILICFFTQACNFVSKQETQSADVGIAAVSDTIVPNSYGEGVAALASRVVPSVEDTVKQQLGGKLYFSSEKVRVQPSDSITVIKINHYNSEEYGQRRLYAFIVHDKYSEFHKPFTVKSLMKEHKAYLVKDPDMPHRYSESNKKQFDQDMATQKKAVGKVHIDPAIKNYVGHWIYLKEYQGQFYIDSDWSFLPSFHISEDAITHHYMGGLYLLVIKSFVKEENGDLLITLSEGNTASHYEQVDKELGVYREGSSYMTPAKNVHHFEIIEYANNAADLHECVVL